MLGYLGFDCRLLQQSSAAYLQTVRQAAGVKGV
jgi:hypothetical protein